MLLHTLIDMARSEAEEGGREINHHGKAITVGGPKEEIDTDLLVNRVRQGVVWGWREWELREEGLREGGPSIVLAIGVASLSSWPGWAGRTCCFHRSRVPPYPFFQVFSKEDIPRMTHVIGQAPEGKVEAGH